MKRLYRSRYHQMLGGVCMGIAKHMNVDVTLVRLVWVIAGLSWVGIPAYIIAWIIIPEDSAAENEVDVTPEQSGTGVDTRTIGLIIVAVGAYLLMRQLIPIVFWGRFFWPVLLVAVGVIVMFGGFGRGSR